MAEYIDKQKALDAISRAYGDIAEAEDRIRALPAADVSENVKGEWIHGRKLYETRLCDGTIAVEYDNYRCSVCGLKVDKLLYRIDNSPFYKFCPNCGADMKGKDNDEKI